MRLSPFPADAVRPWRGVLLYAWHGLYEQMRSPWFWVLQLAIPVMIGLGAALPPLVEHLQRAPVPEAVPQMLVVAPDDGVRAAVASWLEDHTFDDAPRIVLASGTPAQDATVLHLDGTLPDQLTPRMTAPDAEARDAFTDDAADLVAGVRRRAVMTQEAYDDAFAAPEDDTRDEDRVAAIAHDLGLLGKEVAPGMLAVFTGLGLMFGWGAGTTVQTLRHKGYAGILRVGTPASVLYLGALLEAQGIAIIGWSPILLGMGMLVLVGGAATLILVPVVSWGWLAAGGLGAVVAGLTAWWVGAGVATVVAKPHTGDKRATLSMGSMATPILLLTAVAAYPVVMATEGWLARVCTFLPVIGMSRGAALLLQDGIDVALILAVLAQLLWMGLAVRVGTWAYRIEEPVWDEARRAARRLLGAA